MSENHRKLTAELQDSENEVENYSTRRSMACECNCIQNK